MFLRIFELKDATQEFMTVKGKPLLQHDSSMWLTDFVFLMDVSFHLNELDLKLQSKAQVVDFL